MPFFKPRLMLQSQCSNLSMQRERLHDMSRPLLEIPLMKLPVESHVRDADAGVCLSSLTPPCGIRAVRKSSFSRVRAPADRGSGRWMYRAAVFHGLSRLVRAWRPGNLSQKLRTATVSSCLDEFLAASPRGAQSWGLHGWSKILNLNVSNRLWDLTRDF